MSGPMRRQASEPYTTIALVKEKGEKSVVFIC